jgi:hypothetical protein
MQVRESGMSRSAAPGQRGQRGGGVSLIHKLKIGCVRQWSARLESDREKEWIMQLTAMNARRFC